MAQKPSLWTRIKHFVSPPRETYDSRQARPGDPSGDPANPVYEATDRRRSGGTMEIGPY